MALLQVVYNRHAVDGSSMRIGVGMFMVGRYLKTHLHFVNVLLWVLLALQVNVVVAQSVPLQKLRVVGGLAGLNQYTRHEEPFWSRNLPQLSGGKFVAEIVPFDQAGVPGGDMLRQIQLGVLPFGTALISNVTAKYAEFGAPDLAGLNPDMATLRKSVAAFRPYLQKAMRERHGVEVLAVYTYPAQVVFCKSPMSSLQDLAKRRIRVSSVTQSDFVSALGAVPMLTGFNQIVPSMTSGKIDCAITGAMSGNKLGLHEVTAYQHTMPVTWGLAMFAANSAAWKTLNPELKDLLIRELPKLETEIWAESERETLDGVVCNTGAAACVSGRKGKMIEVQASPKDELKRKEILVNALQRWQQRCTVRCVDIWNQTMGQLPGAITLVAKSRSS
jgi:TRAP-type C4-dicarboxylate transport system substrate-binding protein